jgi:hypothetical protein
LLSTNETRRPKIILMVNISSFFMVVNAFERVGPKLIKLYTSVICGCS